MKRYTTVLLAVFFAMTLSAETSYYYSRGEKIPLEIDESKIVTILNDTINDIPLTFREGSLVKMGKDSKCKVGLFELSKGVTRRQIEPNALLEATILQPCFISSIGQEMIPNGYINVKLKEPSGISILQELGEKWGFEIVEQDPFMPLWFNIRQCKNLGINAVELANMIFETGDFAASSPSFSMDCLEISYDPNVYEQWALYNSNYEDIDISISNAWNYATGKGVVIAIIDDGVDKDHIDLKDNIHHLSYDAETGTEPSQRRGFHGTQCAGIMSAVRNNGIMMAGVAPDAKLMVISADLLIDDILPKLSINIENKFAKGINWAWQNGADVISCSWGIGENDDVKDAIDNAFLYGREGKGCVVVNSAGNTFSYSSAEKLQECLTFPANYSEVIAVGNIRNTGQIKDDSSRGENLFVCAPGTDIIRTWVHNKIVKEGHGTSFACPHVAGIVALMLERNPNLTLKQIREIIGKSAKKVGRPAYNLDKEYGKWNNIYGYGLIDAYECLMNTPLCE